MSQLKEKDGENQKDEESDLSPIESSEIFDNKTSPKKTKRAACVPDSTNCAKKAKTFQNTNQDSCGTASTSAVVQEENLTNEPKETDRRKSKIKVDVESTEIKNVLQEMDGEIDEALEQTALKNKLSARNVKNILRHVITNEHVLAMVRNTMRSNGEDEEMDEAVYEPKLTRSKVKELREKQHELPWLVYSPLKQPDEEIASRKLLEEVFSEESSSDEDYEPKKDEEEEENRSDEDECPSSQVNDTEECDEKSPGSPVIAISDDANDDENRLVIVLPSGEVGDLESTEVDKIALRTRSKLPLNDTPLEAIEASFVAPDITVDMYDTECDNEDWRTFLRELSKPLDSEFVIEQPEDDIEDDPEYNILQDDDIPDSWDLRNDKAVKISRKELNALMAEILESAEFDPNDCEEEEDDDGAAIWNENQGLTNIPGDNAFNFTLLTPMEMLPMVQSVFQLNMFESSNEKLQLEEQMRMHVQLLAQSYVLSYGVSELSYVNESSKTLLNEIKMFASRERASETESVFNSYNLDKALDIIKDFEFSNEVVVVSSQIKKQQKGIPTISSTQVKQILCESKAFIYPDLLPVCSFRDDVLSKQKTFFTASEDNLIAIGLEEFSFCKDPVHYIKTLLVPAKTEYQIKIRIKNSRSMKAYADNPIKHYYKYKETPQMSRTVTSFDPEKVKSPRDNPPDILPHWMRPFSTVKSLQTAAKRLRPLAAKVDPDATPVHPQPHKTPDKRKLNPIVARSLHNLSPLKKISPILKKYNQQRRGMPLIQLGSGSKGRRKSSSFVNRQNYKPPLIKPKPTEPSIQFLDVSNTSSSLKAPASSQVVFAVPAVQTLNSEMRGKKPANSTQCKENSSSSESLRARRGQDKLTLKPKVPEANTEIEVSEDVEEEAVDDEQDLAALMAASSTICKKQQSANKKRNKLQRDLESSLALLKPYLVESDPKREEREQLFASTYILRVTETLKEEPETYEKFLKTLCKYQYSTRSPVNLYFELKEVLKDHPLLVDDFVAFLRPDQAKQCGKFKEFTLYYKIREFIRKIEVHFSHQPQHLMRILRTFGQLRSQAHMTSKEILSTLQPLLRNQSHLMEELQSLLPDAPPPEYLMAEEDFEEVAIPDSDDDNSSVDSYEEVVIPETPDPYGGKDCPCECHTLPGETKQHNKSKHCMKCGLKFIDGRIYVQSGKVLKPVKVTLIDVPEEVRERVREEEEASRRERLQQEVQFLHIQSEVNNASQVAAEDNLSDKEVLCSQQGPSKLVTS